MKVFFKLGSFLSIVFIGASLSVHSQTIEDREVPAEREIHNTFSEDQKKGTLLDATNPMELINRLRQATSMDNATSPSDAIDDALKALEDQEIDSSSIEVAKPKRSKGVSKSLL